jgi:Family of unknown function (DUF6185)
VHRIMLLRYSIFLVFALVGLLLFLPSPSAHADVNCDAAQLSSAYATADLSVTVPSIDDATWTSTMEFVIPASWNMAGELFQSPSSQAFQNAYNCISPTPYFLFPEGTSLGTTSVTFSQGNVILKQVQHGPIYWWLVINSTLPSPWSLSSSQGNISISFGPASQPQGQSSVPIPWEAVTATINGFQVFAPTPLPSSEPSATESVWDSQPKKPLSHISFTLVPSRTLRMALTSEGGASAYYVPIDIEEFIMSIVLIIVLGRRRPSLDIADRIRPTIWRLCLLVAVLSFVNFWPDLGAGNPLGSLLNSLNVQTTIISAFGLDVVWQLSKWPGKLLASIAFIPSAAGMFLSPIGELPSLFFCWIVILDGVHALFQPSYRHPRRLVVSAVLLVPLSILLQLGGSSDNPFPDYSMTSISACIIVFGIAAVIARTRRPIPLLLEKGDRLLFSLAIGYAVLFVAPQWYAGIHVDIVFPIAIAITAAVLSIGQRHSLAQLAADALRGKKPDQLQGIQRKLIDAEERLDEISKNLKILEGVPLTRDQVKQRDQLKREQDGLKRWPTVSDESPTGAIARMKIGLHRLLGTHPRNEQPELKLPGAAGPADMALALGPGCDPWQNAKKAFLPGVGLILVPVIYFAWRESFTGPQFISFPYSYSDFVINLCQELTFWLFPLLVLAVAWSSLAGRRGPGRSIQIWLCISLPLIVHAFINDAFDQSGTLTPILRCALLLIAILSLGLWLDLSTLRLYHRNITSFRLFEGYVRLNRVAAVLTILVPLITAGFTIWNQIDSGVLHQQQTPTQSSVQGPSPSSSHSSPPPAGH